MPEWPILNIFPENLGRYLRGAVTVVVVLVQQGSNDITR
jgi:hypothetical protein